MSTYASLTRPAALVVALALTSFGWIGCQEMTGPQTRPEMSNHPGSAGSPPSQATPGEGGASHSKATGEVSWMAGIERSAEFDAHEEAPGNPGDRGTFRHSDANGTFTVDVTCVSISGEEARFGGPIVEASGQYAGQAARVTYVKDGGTPGSEGDKLGGLFKESEATACEAVEDGFTRGFPITSGNLQVQDGS